MLLLLDLVGLTLTAKRMLSKGNLLKETTPNSKKDRIFPIACAKRWKYVGGVCSAVIII